MTSKRTYPDRLPLRSAFDSRKFAFSWPYGTSSSIYLKRACMFAPIGWQFVNHHGFRFDSRTKFYASRIPMLIVRLR